MQEIMDSFVKVGIKFVSYSQNKFFYSDFGGFQFQKLLYRVFS